MEKMKMPDLGTSKNEQNPISEQELEKRREHYAKTLKKAAFRENFDAERILDLSFLKNKAIKNPEDIMLAEAYAYNELRDTKKKDLEEEGKDEKEVSEFLAELDKEFYDADLMIESAGSFVNSEAKLGGLINGHKVEIIQTSINHSEVRYKGYVDKREISEEKSKELFDKYHYLGILKYNAVGEAIKMNEKDKSVNS